MGYIHVLVRHNVKLYLSSVATSRHTVTTTFKHCLRPSGAGRCGTWSTGHGANQISKLRRLWMRTPYAAPVSTRRRLELALPNVDITTPAMRRRGPKCAPTTVPTSTFSPHLFLASC